MDAATRIEYPVRPGGLPWKCCTRRGFIEPSPDNAVVCTLCPHDCHIHDGGRGVCAMRFNYGGKLFTLVYDKIISREIDPIEKKPLFHFLPGSRAYSVATVGCNLRCSFCQNWQDRARA